jgi:hypothetical protein
MHNGVIGLSFPQLHLPEKPDTPKNPETDLGKEDGRVSQPWGILPSGT